MVLALGKTCLAVVDFLRHPILKPAGRRNFFEAAGGTRFVARTLKGIAVELGRQQGPPFLGLGRGYRRSREHRRCSHCPDRVWVMPNISVALWCIDYFAFHGNTIAGGVCSRWSGSIARGENRGVAD